MTTFFVCLITIFILGNRPPGMDCGGNSIQMQLPLLLQALISHPCNTELHRRVWLICCAGSQWNCNSEEHCLLPVILPMAQGKSSHRSEPCWRLPFVNYNSGSCLDLMPSVPRVSTMASFIHTYTVWTGNSLLGKPVPWSQRYAWFFLNHAIPRHDPSMALLKTWIIEARTASLETLLWL